MRKIKEIIGDYSMAGSRRYDAPGNIRSDRFVKGYRGNVLDDAASENVSSLRAAIVFIERSDGKILAVSRPYDNFDMNLPGGVAAPDERLEDTARRELLEETGLTVEKLEKIFSGYNNGSYVEVFKGHGLSGHQRNSPEGQVKWVGRGELQTGTYGRFFTRMCDAIDL